MSASGLKFRHSVAHGHGGGPAAKGLIFDQPRTFHELYEVIEK
jgi:hypothetical protein